MKHLLEVDDLSKDELIEILALASKPPPRLLKDCGVALIFQKPSARTRNSMEMAAAQLGAHPVYIQEHEIGFDRRESVEDLTRTLACFHRILCARVNDHSIVERMAATDAGGVAPVINMLSDRAHPLQALADVLTLQGEFGSLEGRTIAYIGDANNVARSLALACSKVSMRVRVAHPPGYGFDDDDFSVLRSSGADFELFDSPGEAVRGVDAVYTDVWISMGQEDERSQRLADFESWTVDEALMRGAAPEAIFMHCLPAHDDQECTRAVLEANYSRIWTQAKNRMHAARAVMWWLNEQI